MEVLSMSEEEKKEIRDKHTEAIKKYRDKVEETKKGLPIPTKKTSK